MGKNVSLVNIRGVQELVELLSLLSSRKVTMTTSALMHTDYY